MKHVQDTEDFQTPDLKVKILTEAEQIQPSPAVRSTED